MPSPDISVVIPARNEGMKLAPTIQAIARARTTDARVEFIIVDDASNDETASCLVASAPRLLEEPGIDIQVHRLDEHAGIYRARNVAASLASADILFCTDAHVEFSNGWDELVFAHIGRNVVLSGTTTVKGTPFRGYGCDLLVPFMGTSWNLGPVDEVAHVPIAPCHATVIARELFERLGGYDDEMMIYGAGEPELSIRAWLHGADVMLVRDLEVSHEFKPKEQLSDFIRQVRPFWVHNCLRFGFLYLSELGCMQMLRYYARAFPDHFADALSQVNRSDVWQRRSFLEGQRQRSFDWLVEYFGIRDQAGGEIL